MSITQILDDAQNGDLEAIRRTLNIQPGLVNVHDGDGRMPLHRAAESGNLELLHLLMERGAEINGENFNGHTAMHFAAFYGQFETCLVLLKYGAFIDHIGHKDGNVPLHFACGQGQTKTIEVLVNKGANLKITNFKGQLPLHWAVQNEHQNTASKVNEMYNLAGDRWKRTPGSDIHPPSRSKTLTNDLKSIGIQPLSPSKQIRDKHLASMGFVYDSSNTLVRTEDIREKEDGDAAMEKARRLESLAHVMQHRAEANEQNKFS